MPDMMAAILHQINAPLVVEQVHLEIPGPGEVLVRMAVAGVCHSDLHALRGHLRQPLPIVLGHEGAGIVEAVGPEVTALAPGTRVALLWISSCGTCFYCQRGQAHLCEHGDPMAKTSRITWNGHPVHHFLSTSAFAEYVVVRETGVLPVGDDISLEQVALLSCGVATGVGAVRNAARVPTGASVAVFGCGGVGLNVVQGARLVGAERIIAVDRVPAKLDLARRFGATDALDVSPAGMDVVAAVRDLTGGRGVDYAFEAIGSVEVARQALSAVRRGGVLVLVGMPPMTSQMEVRGLPLVLQEKSILTTLYGSMGPREHIPQLIEWVRDGRLRLDELISQRFTLGEINQALEKMERGEMARGVITFASEAGEYTA